MRGFKEQRRVEIEDPAVTRLTELSLCMVIPPGPEHFPQFVMGALGSEQQREAMQKLLDATAEERYPWQLIDE